MIRSLPPGAGIHMSSRLPGFVRKLLERRLIRILGKKEIPGRPLIYATTKQFLEIFDLKDLKDLPTPEEIETLKEASSEHMG